VPLSNNTRLVGSANRPNKYSLLPPLNETNFNEQYKNYNSQQRRSSQLPKIGTKPYDTKRLGQMPVFVEERYPVFVPSMNIGYNL